MRPGVYAGVMRNRTPKPRRKPPTEHKFSWRQCFIMLSVGVVLIIPGIIVTVIGIENTGNLDNIPGDESLYKYIGPGALAFGIGLVVAAGLYYCCWGFQSPVTNGSKRHTSQQNKTKQTNNANDEQSDPLQTSSVPAISSHTHGASTYSSVRSHGSPSHKATKNGDHVHTSSISLDHGTNHSHTHHKHRTSSKSSADGASIRSHQSSRHRSSSTSHNHNNHPHTSQPHNKHTHAADTQVTFADTTAPLAQGESGMDMSIDMDVSLVDLEKKY